mmetsp:Transcript_43745/g.104314  ORF Transcript_43745/g.104314 Transcript_43745/m.104314 type:complete len:208 (+) Transcript_43745:632-1255(+)
MPLALLRGWRSGRGGPIEQHWYGQCAAWLLAVLASCLLCVVRGAGDPRPSAPGPEELPSSEGALAQRDAHARRDLGPVAEHPRAPQDRRGVARLLRRGGLRLQGGEARGLCQGYAGAAPMEAPCPGERQQRRSLPHRERQGVARGGASSRGRKHGGKASEGGGALGRPQPGGCLCDLHQAPRGSAGLPPAFGRGQRRHPRGFATGTL